MPMYRNAPPNMATPRLGLRLNPNHALPQIDFWVKSDCGLLHRGTKLGISRREIARIAQVFEGEHSMRCAQQHENA